MRSTSYYLLHNVCQFMTKSQTGGTCRKLLHVYELIVTKTNINFVTGNKTRYVLFELHY